LRLDIACYKKVGTFKKFFSINYYITFNSSTVVYNMQGRSQGSPGAGGPPIEISGVARGAQALEAH